MVTYFPACVTVGLLLSDGSLTQTRNNASLVFEQGIVNSQYFWHVFSLLSHYCTSLPSPTLRLKGGRGVYSGLRFRTHSYPVFTACLRSEWYNQGIKGIPESIFDDLTPVALAHWAKGDGSKCGAGFRFATNHSHTSDRA